MKAPQLERAGMAIATLVAVALLAHSNVPASSKAAPPRSTSSSSPHAVARVTRAATDTALPGVDKAARARPNRVSPPTPTPPEPAIIKPKGPIPFLVSASVRATIKKCYNRTQNVWLTFDDGYTSQANLDSILATLKKYNVRGRFFPTGSWARTHASMVNQIRAEGHYVENHTGNHAHLNRLDDAAVSNEIATGQAASSSPKLLRPPYGDGAYTSRVYYLAAQQGYRLCTWGTDTMDWAHMPASVIIKKAVTGDARTPPAGPGDTVLMHLRNTQTRYALPKLIDGLLARGLTFDTLR